MTTNKAISPVLHRYDDIEINTAIPATMAVEGLRYLGKLAQAVPQGGTIVEVGPLYGSSTWVLSKNAHPSVKIFSIDTWEPAEWINRRFPDGPEFSVETFREMTADCPNVTAIQGWSPQIVADWDRPIDLFFDDATHGDPGFSENLKFFSSFLKPNAILCGDDFAAGWPDIVRVVNELADSWDCSPEVIGRVWSVINGGSYPVHSRLAPWGLTELRVATTNRAGRISVGAPYAWAGNPHERSPLTSLRVWPRQGTTTPSLRYQIRDREGASSQLAQLNEKLVSPNYISNMRFELDDDAAGQSVYYRLCWYAVHPRRCTMTPWLADGQWADLPADARIAGVRLAIEPSQELQNTASTGASRSMAARAINKARRLLAG